MKNPLKAIGRVLMWGGKGLLSALRFAESRGYSDEVFDFAVSLVTRAHTQFPTNDERFKWAVAALRARTGVPESVARWTIEGAVLAYKKQVGG